MMKNRVFAGYVRVSRKEQAKDSDSLTRQIFQVRKAIEELGGVIGEDTLFIDIQSGRKDDRPQFQKLFDLIKAKKVDCVVILRVDRIARHLEMNAKLAETFEKTGVELYEILRGSKINFHNPSDWEHFAHAGVRSEGESRMLSHRVKGGFEYFRYQGKASPSVPFGYMRLEGKYAHNPDEIQAARKSVEIFLEAQSVRAARRMIQEELEKTWNEAGLGLWLRNPVLRGHTYYPNSGVMLYDTHPELAIVSKEEDEQIEAIFKKNTRLWGKNRKARTYPLSGLMVCADCGETLSISYSAKGYTYAYCYNRCSTTEPCPWAAQKREPGRKKGIRVEEVEKLVIQALCERREALADSYASALQPKEEINPKLKEIERQIRQVEKLVRQIGDEDGLLVQKIANLNAEAAKYQKTGMPPPDTERARKELIEAGTEFWITATDEEKQILFQWWLKPKGIVIRRGVVESIGLEV